MEKIRRIRCGSARYDTSDGTGLDDRGGKVFIRVLSLN